MGDSQDHGGGVAQLTSKRQEAFSAQTPRMGLVSTLQPRVTRIYSFTAAEQLPVVSTDRWLAAVQADEQLSPERKAVAKVLTRYADRETGRNVRPAVLTVARQLSRSTRSVGAHLVGLASTGWLSRTGKASKGVIVYALTLPTTT